MLIQYLAGNEAKEQKLLENPKLFKTPIVRNGKQATIGYRPDIWKTWE
jgi:arsenate reductase-like glutaredoxin family protein